MFTKSEIKDALLEYGRKYLFPDFTNKLTWLIAGAGATIIVTPTPLKVIAYNWLIDTANLNYGTRFTFAELKPDSADYTIGLILIIAALAHNITYRFFIYKEKIAATLPVKVSKADEELFKKFLQVFPSDSASMHILRSHDFGGAFNMDNLAELENFTNEWDTAEKEFLDDDLEAMRKTLWEACSSFNHKLSMNAYDLHGGPMFSCIPDMYRGTDNWPNFVDDKLKELNTLSAQCDKLHREFVMHARRKFDC